MSSAKEIESGAKTVLETSAKTFEDATKASVKGLEQVLKFWTGSLRGNGVLEEWQKYTKAVLDRVTPAVQKTAEEWVKLYERNYTLSAELLKKAVETNGAGSSLAAATERTQKAWKSTFDAVRDNAEAAVQANARVAELWTDVVRKNVAQGESLVRSAAAKASASAKAA